MLTYAVHDDIPAPEPSIARFRYPFREMKVGQCAVFDIDAPEFHEGRIRKLIHVHMLRNKLEFTARLDRKDGVFRVWRIS